MSKEIKCVLLIIVICMISTLIAGYEHKQQKNKLTNTINDINKDIEENYVLKSTIEENKAEEEIKKEEEIEEEVKYVDVWTIEDAAIKKEPCEDSENIGTYYWNTKISVEYINDDWVNIKGSEYYISRKLLSETPVNFTDCDVPYNNTIKSYMDYRRITLKSSKQYKLQSSKAYTDKNGIRMVNGRYCVALGSYYTTTIGQYVDIELENGSVIQGILADCKDDKHTDDTNRINPNGSVVEFVVDTKSLYRKAKIMGDISYINGWNSKVVNIRVYDKIEKY